ncbi:YbjQ family protein [Planctomycetota bacterium]
MDDIQIFTTPILDGIKIREYKGVVIVRNVRAVNIIRDFFTSFRDIFGGRSASYQEVMESMEGDVIAELKEEARNKGANAIIGFTLDYDNIGSKSKSLIMASAKGTAVVIE